MDKFTSDVEVRNYLIGAYAHSIRFAWSEDVELRIDRMRELMGDGVGPYYIDDDEAVYDGRWFRDSWDGPYNAFLLDGFTQEQIKNYRNDIMDLMRYTQFTDDEIKHYVKIYGLKD